MGITTEFQMIELEPSQLKRITDKLIQIKKYRSFDTQPQILSELQPKNGRQDLPTEV